MPFAGYSNFAECVRKNSDKANPRAYCGKIMSEAETREDGGTELSASSGTVTVGTLVNSDKAGLLPDLKDDMMGMSMPYGGATSFAEVDDYEQSAAVQDGVMDVARQFQGIVNNIWCSMDMDIQQKADAVASAAGDLSTRLRGAVTEETSERGVMGFVKDLLGGAKAAGGFTARDFADVGDSTKPSTWKLRLGSSPGSVDVTHISGAIQALSPAGFRGNRVSLGSPKATVISKISGAINRVSADADTKKKLRERLSKVKDFEEVGTTRESMPMTVFKDAAGKWRYIAIASNTQRDKEDEEFPAEAHEEFVEWCDKTGDYPVLCLWHDLRTKVGTGDAITFDPDTGYRVSTGTFDDGMEDVAERLSGMPDIVMSHGFVFNKAHLQDGKYRRYRTFEETVLPEAKYAANEDTSFIVAREEPMAIPQVKREFFEQVLGKDRFARLEESLGERASSMSDAELGAAVKEAMAEKPDVPAVPGGPSAPVLTDPVVAAAPPPTPATDPPPAGASTEVGTTDLIKAMQQALPGVVQAGMKEALEPINEQLTELKTWRTGVDEQLAALKVTSDERVASMFGIRGLDPSKVTAPSDASGNTVSTEAGDQLVQALGGKDEDENGKTPVDGIVEMLRKEFRTPSVTA